MTRLFVNFANPGSGYSSMLVIAAVAAGLTGAEDEAAIGWHEFSLGREKLDQAVRAQIFRRAGVKAGAGTKAPNDGVAERRNRVGCAGFRHHAYDFVTVN